MPIIIISSRKRIPACRCSESVKQVKPNAL